MFGDRYMIGVMLAIFWITGVYYDCKILLHIWMVTVSIYDLLYTARNLRNWSSLKMGILLGVGIIMMIFNEISLLLYYSDPGKIIQISTITQINDVLQYLCGSLCRYPHYIGWISPKKTYEGYFGGLILSVLVLGLYYPITEIFFICILGNLGGLISSICKRILEIKDYSILLGSHGGWLDRIDSIWIPIFWIYLEKVWYM